VASFREISPRNRGTEKLEIKTWKKVSHNTKEELRQHGVNKQPAQFVQKRKHDVMAVLSVAPYESGKFPTNTLKGFCCREPRSNRNFENLFWLPKNFGEWGVAKPTSP